ncbi:aminoacyl--tRNA ligase-related protein [uncultured Sunxiuqinia sp.]|uniref:aminoacyl--tRNA ligase-related protein n=1 Tax=uncultured Sunxiuqinia sp. TaxID=1573825 RepID=UPI002AA6AD3B|nr:aminoacyl--tRNA ligase-related protein [uncultured Sunxiuqinia sp.]
MQRALINFFLDEARDAGYLEIQPPLVVNEGSGFGTGQLPDKEGQMYHVTEDNLYLIPTAEVPVTNFVPRCDFGCQTTACEKTRLTVHASVAKPDRMEKMFVDSNRLHQFDKVEVVQVAHPEKSYDILDQMVAHVESLVTKLGPSLSHPPALWWRHEFLPAALTYDFEVFSAAQEKWLEVSSVSNFESFQANRLKTSFP